MGGIEIMTAIYASSGSFRSILRAKYFVHNTYTVRISNFS